MEWANCKKNLPSKVGCYLGFYFSGYIGLVYYDGFEWIKIWGTKKLDITHWMPLPEPPND